MAYQAHHGAGHTGYQHGDAGPNEAYFDRSDDESPFAHYKDTQYDKDSDLSEDYHEHEEEEQKKEEEQKENTLIDNIKKEEKAKKEESWENNVSRKASDEIRHEQMAVGNKQDKAAKKKRKAHKSIEEAIKEASKDKKELFVLK